LFANPVDGQVYAQPLYVANVVIPNQGIHNVVYVATENNTVYAFDADTHGAPLWQTSLSINGGTAVPSSDVNCPDVVPVIGVTGTPVIDPTTNTLYVVAKTKEGPSYFQRLHALDIATGAEKFGGPVAIEATVSGTGDGSNEANNLYVMTGNGTFDANQPNGMDFGDSVLKLAQSGNTLSLVVYFTPFNQASLEADDTDLGSGAPMVLPNQSGSSLLVGAGKE